MERLQTEGTAPGADVGGAGAQADRSKSFSEPKWLLDAFCLVVTQIAIPIGIFGLARGESQRSDCHSNALVDPRRIRGIATSPCSR